MSRSHAADHAAFVVARNHVLSFETTPEEEIEDKSYHREEDKCYYPGERADWIAVFLEHHDNAAYDRNGISYVDNRYYPIVYSAHP